MRELEWQESLSQHAVTASCVVTWQCAGPTGKDAVLRCMEEKRDALMRANAAKRRELVAVYTAEVSRPQMKADPLETTDTNVIMVLEASGMVPKACHHDGIAQKCFAALQG